VRVMAGIVNGSWTEIENIAALKGLPVVVSGQSMLNDGDRITPINPPETEK